MPNNRQITEFFLRNGKINSTPKRNILSNENIPIITIISKE